MSPRAYAQPGLRGPGQEHFPSQARESGRDLGLTGEVTILEDAGGTDGAGSPKSEWKDGATIRGRIDPLTSSTRAFDKLEAGQIKEVTTHVVSVDAGAAIETSNRLRIDGMVWLITTKVDRTDPLIERVGARVK